MKNKKMAEPEEKPTDERAEADLIEFIPIEEQEQPGAPASQEPTEKEQTEPLSGEEKTTEDKEAGEHAPVEAEGGKEGEKKGETGQPSHGHGPTETEDTGKIKTRLHKKEAEIKALRQERDEWKDKYLRSLAEMDNARKRLERERDEYMKYALTDFLKELLLVVDNFERALQVKDESDGRSFQEGVAMIYRQLMEFLRRLGVRPVESSDKKFDPNVHQAVLTEEAEGIEEPEVAEFLQRGYWLHDRLLRPAMVKVLVPKKNP